MHNDKINNYHILVESAGVESSAHNIKQVNTNNGLSFLRFNACLQLFDELNENRRMWRSTHMRQMIASREVQNKLKHGSFVGECSHPIPTVGQPTPARIRSIDSERVSHRITKLYWERSKLFGVVETLDDGEGRPGRALMKNILQGIDPGFSVRALVPQIKQADGSIIVTGPGILACWDRVYGPSCPDAHIDFSIPIKNIIKENTNVEVALESIMDYTFEQSDKLRTILDKMDPVFESAVYDVQSDMVSVKTKSGVVYIAPEMKFRNEFKSALNTLF